MLPAPSSTVPELPPMSSAGRRERYGAVALMIVVTILGWAFLLLSPFGASGMPMNANWGIGTVVAVFLMWGVMMAAMMMPSAMPMVLTFVRLASRSTGAGRAAMLFGLAYLAVWSAFSGLATGIHWGLQASGILSPMMVSRSLGLTAAILLVAGLFQFSPLKASCLTRCRDPMTFLMSEWRSGPAGAWVMGLRHGVFCVGCCWALMGVLFVVGVMNLPWVALIAVLVALEKMAPHGVMVARLNGVAMMAAGVLTLASLTV